MSLEKRDLTDSTTSASEVVAATSITDDLVQQLSTDSVALRRFVSDFHLLKEAIERAPMPYCVYDQDDSLLATNHAYEILHPVLKEMRSRIGSNGRLLYADLVREQIRNYFPPSRLEEEVQKRVTAQREADGTPTEREYGSHGIYRVVKYRLGGGGTAGLALDITELKHREEELVRAKTVAEAATVQAGASLEIERSRKYQNRGLSELGEWLQSCKSLRELFQIVERFMSRMFVGSSGELYVYSNSRDVLDGACHWNRGEGLRAHIHPDDCWALRRGRMMRFGTGLIDIPCAHVHDHGTSLENNPYVCIPIIAHGETVGLLHIRFGLKTDPNSDAFSERTLPFAIRCAEQISLAIANVKLRDELTDQSTKDPLTGLWNRRHLMNRCRQELSRLNKSASPLSVIAIDADKFKLFNDVHGHDAGDTVLCHIADVMRSVVSGPELAARMGGEEFLILLPGLDADSARTRAEMLRLKIEALRIKYGEGTLPQVTISLGVAEAGGAVVTAQDLLTASDRALYAAKDAGRNQVICASDHIRIKSGAET